MALPPLVSPVPYAPVGAATGLLTIVPERTEPGALANESPVATAVASEPLGAVTRPPDVCADVACPSTEAALVLTIAGSAVGTFATVPASLPSVPSVVSLPLSVTACEVQDEDVDVPPTASAVPPAPTGIADRWSAIVPAMVPFLPLVSMSPPPVAACVTVPLVAASFPTATALLAACRGTRFCERITLPCNVCPVPSLVTGVGAA